VSNLFCNIQNIYIFATMQQINHGSLFSGFGGFDLAAEWMGWNNVFHCEWMPFPRQILKYHFPNSISYEDITKTDFTIHRGTIDVLTGGFPCQPYSVAGKRLGKEDERHLWPEMLRAIREIEPRFVVGENVRGLVNWNGGMVFDEVQADLENAGYEVIPFIIPACAVGAPHRRDRVWFVAKNTKCNGRLFGESEQERASNGQQRNTCSGGSNGICLSKGFVAHANDTRGGSRLGEISEWNNDAESCDPGSGIASNALNHRQRKEKFLANREKKGLKAIPSALNQLRQDDNPAKNTGKRNQDSLQKRAFQTTGKTSQLNPLFVAEMMGFPPNWTVLPFQSGETSQSKDTETP
jgi:DNA-cytosine methyltransferase